MHDFTRRSLLQGGTALAAGAALTGPALLDFARAWAQASPPRRRNGSGVNPQASKRAGDRQSAP